MKKDVIPIKGGLARNEGLPANPNSGLVETRDVISFGAGFMMILLGIIVAAVTVFGFPSASTQVLPQGDGGTVIVMHSMKEIFLMLIAAVLVIAGVLLILARFIFAAIFGRGGSGGVHTYYMAICQNCGSKAESAHTIVDHPDTELLKGKDEFCKGCKHSRKEDDKRGDD